MCVGLIDERKPIHVGAVVEAEMGMGDTSMDWVGLGHNFCILFCVGLGWFPTSMRDGMRTRM